ncbi:MAG: hypothetical protein HY360_15925 [Verrucomicrobia bacterium]|nr:hypothetical protein [Verrucomicrobiota bacterium]
MKRAPSSVFWLAWLFACQITAALAADGNPPAYLWFEPEWFEGVEKRFAYWPNFRAGPTNNTWGVMGPGISAEWTQGGESEWNSMGAAAWETRASCHRDFMIPRAGKYKVWMRYADHRGKTEPFSIRLTQGGATAITGELGVQPVVPPNDEYQLYWGFSFGWGMLEGGLKEGAARIELLIDKPGQEWRQVDAILITDDLSYTPCGREKPPFGYLEGFAFQPKDGALWRGTGKGINNGAGWKRQKLADREFTVWAGVELEPKWWGTQNLETLKPFDVFFNLAGPADIRAKFVEQFKGKADVPVTSWKHLAPNFLLGAGLDLSPGTPVRKWLERTKTPFSITTNYADPSHTAFNATNGPAIYLALSGPLAEQFMGFIHGEAVGSVAVGLPQKPLHRERREHVDKLGKHLLKTQAEEWSKHYKTQVPESFRSKSIPCLSCESIALAHLFHEIGSKAVGYEEDATNAHVPMRIAFERGAARQYGGAWINYASGNFGDACNYFYQNPVVPRGAGSWFHSKYAVTDGVSAAWYRKMYYLNYMSGASAIHWEQGLGNQWFLPGPGNHPVQLSPFGRATEDFMAFVDRLPDRGEPYTPIAILLSYGHGYERVNYNCKMLDFFRENAADLELRELFNVLWHPAGILEGMPQAPDVQSMPGGVYGNLFDVLVDRPERAAAIMDYPVLWAAGDVDLGGKLLPLVEDYVKRGGTLVANVEAAKGKLKEDLLGVKFKNNRSVTDGWLDEEGMSHPAGSYELEQVELAGAKALASASQDLPLITRHQVGEGAVILTLAPRMLGRDERAHPSLPYLMNGLCAQLLPVEVRLADGKRLEGEIMYQLNRIKDGWLVTLINNRGIDKTQNGVARVDRRAFTDVILRAKLPVASAREYTQPASTGNTTGKPRDLTIEKKGDACEILLRIHPGDVQVVAVLTAGS